MPATHNFHHIVTWKTLPHVHYYFIILRILYMDFSVISDDLYQPLLKKKHVKTYQFFQINVGRLGLSEEVLVSRETKLRIEIGF